MNGQGSLTVAYGGKFPKPSRTCLQAERGDPGEFPQLPPEVQERYQAYIMWTFPRYTVQHKLQRA